MDADVMSVLQRPINTVPTILTATHAEQVLDRLRVVISEFMETIRPDQEIAIALASFGQSHTIRVESIKALGPNLIAFSGLEDNRRVQLVQHVSQLNFLLSAEPAVSQVPRRTIGFQAE